MKLRIIATLLIGVFLAAGLFWGVTHAQSFRTGSSATVDTDEVVDSSLWTAARNIHIDGEVNGDVFCAAQNVTISGTVRGDVLCAAQTITISGVVTGDVRATVQTFNLSGRVDRNLSVATQNYSQSGKSQVGGDASIATDQASLGGTIGRDAAITGQDVDVNGSVGRNVSATVTSLSLGSHSVIKGNLHYTSATDVQVARGAEVAGKTTKTTPQAQGQAKQGGAGWFGAGLLLYLVVAGLVTALAMVLFFPQTFHALSRQALTSPGKTVLVGLLAVIVVPVLIMLLMLTIVGIPLALLLLVAWVLMEALAGVAAAYYLGRLLWRRQRNAVVIMLVGAIALLILYLIPIVGFIAFLAAMFFGTGMILRELNRHRPAPIYTVVSPGTKTEAKK